MTSESGDETGREGAARDERKWRRDGAQGRSVRRAKVATRRGAKARHVSSESGDETERKAQHVTSESGDETERKAQLVSIESGNEAGRKGAARVDRKWRRDGVRRRGTCRPVVCSETKRKGAA